jgi:hypothetical protein
MVSLLRRRRGDDLPVAPAAVVLVPIAGPASHGAVLRAIEAAGAGTVAVVMVLPIHGSSFGFPNPGLMPTKLERDETRRAVAETIRAIERRGGQADGQITATREDAKVIAAAARRRAAGWVIIDDKPAAARWRRALEGDLGRAVQRRLGPGVVVGTTSRALPPGPRSG